MAALASLSACFSRASVVRVVCFPKGVKKSNLPQKDCAVCGRPFTWRKKWEKNWDEIRYCSERCRRDRGKQTGGGDKTPTTQSLQLPFRSAAPRSLRRGTLTCASDASATRSPQLALSPTSPQKMMPHSLVSESQDVGNVVHLEHLNINVPDQRLAALFYRGALGLTIDNPGYRDEPAEVVATKDVVWYNLGRQQFHICKGEAQVIKGRVHLCIPSLEVLCAKLTEAQTPLEDTCFTFSVVMQEEGQARRVEVTCPWGNCFVVWESASVPVSLAFYRRTLGARVVSHEDDKSVPMGQCNVVLAPGTVLTFVETEGVENAAEAFTGWHAALYVADFSSAYNNINECGLIFNDHPYKDKCHSMQDALKNKQFRFQDVVDEEGRLLHRFQHEVRSLHHPRYMYPLTNYNYL